jgi:hypothetical protein
MQIVHYTKTNQCIWLDSNKVTVKFRAVIRMRESLRTLVYRSSTQILSRSQAA